MLFSDTGREEAHQQDEHSGSIDTISSNWEEGGAVLLYPMYLMSWTVVMNLTRMVAHQEMKAKGELVEWCEDFVGRVILVSHEWLGYSHPDPTGVQLRALQGALVRLASGEVSVHDNWQLQLFFRENTTLDGKRLSAVLPKCKFWLDYSGVPQDIAAEKSQVHCHDHRYLTTTVEKDMADAVNSIPAYVERSAIILVLTPPAQHTDVPGRVCGFPSWRGRGWCRVELMAAALSRANVRVMRCSGATAPPEFLLGADVLFLPPGEGAFTCCARGHVVNGRPISCDKPKIRIVLEEMLQAAVDHFRKVGDLMMHRFLLCSKPRYLRGLPADDAAPRPVGDSGSPAAAFREVLGWGGADDVLARAGQAPSLLHWAAMAGDAAVIRELLSAGWSGNEPMKVGFRDLGRPPGLLPLHLASVSPDGAFEAALALLDAGANPEAEDVGTLKVRVFQWVASMGFVEQVAAFLDRLPHTDVNKPDKAFGNPPLGAAALVGPVTAPKLRLLIDWGANARASSDMHGVDAALYAACWKEDSDPEAVRLLLDARCSPNMTVRARRFGWKAVYGIARAAVRFKEYRGQQPGPLVAMLAEQSGSTPLHASAAKGDVQVMRLLLEARADATRRNDMGRTPLALATLSFGGVAPGPVEVVLCEGQGDVHVPPAGPPAQPDIVQGPPSAVAPADVVYPKRRPVTVSL